MRAAQDGALPVLKLLLENGASVNLQSPDDGLTALHAGASCSAVEHALGAIQLLLQHGADREVQDHVGRRPLDIFMSSGMLGASTAGVQQQQGASEAHPMEVQCQPEQMVRGIGAMRSCVAMPLVGHVFRRPAQSVPCWN
jgi:ankyrin repeat protein